MKRVIVLAIALVLILVASVGCVAPNYFTLHKGTVVCYNPASIGNDWVVFTDGASFNTRLISVWNQNTLEFKRDSWLISDNVTYLLVHKTDSEFLLMPSNMAGDFPSNRNRSKDCCCK